jgi:DNA-binding NtrC family response regulator
VSTIRVLIVDDNVDLAENLAEILEDEGFEPAVARSGEEAVQRLGEQSFDLVISDMRMDGMSGLDLLRMVNERWPMTPVVVMTAYARDHQVHAARREGAVEILSKPTDAAALVRLVATIASSDARRILLVEDDDDLRDNLVEVLDNLDGASVIAAATVEEARKRLSSGRFDIAIVDVRLPDGSGFVLRDELRALPPAQRPRVVLMTAYADELQGEPSFLEKPFPPSALIAVVRRANIETEGHEPY